MVTFFKSGNQTKVIHYRPISIPCSFLKLLKNPEDAF